MTPVPEPPLVSGGPPRGPPEGLLLLPMGRPFGFVLLGTGVGLEINTGSSATAVSGASLLDDESDVVLTGSGLSLTCELGTGSGL